MFNVRTTKRPTGSHFPSLLEPEQSLGEQVPGLDKQVGIQKAPAHDLNFSPKREMSAWFLEREFSQELFQFRLKERNGLLETSLRIGADHRSVTARREGLARR